MNHLRVALRRLRREDRGASNTAELVILVPILVLIIGVAAVAGRVTQADAVTQNAANAAARAASIERNAGSASYAAHQAANSYLANAGINCASLNVNVNTSGINAALGTVGNVSATVNCTVTFSDLVYVPIAGGKLLTSTATSPVDAFRERR